ncbi:GSCOCG00013683001-RA-CDS, partial [Cotesia congregata]
KKLEEEFKVIFDHSRTRWRQKVLSIVQGRNSPQRTDDRVSEASTSSDGSSPPQQAGLEPVLGQGMPQQLANPSLKFEEPIKKFLTSASKSEDVRPKPKISNNSVSIFNPDVPDAEVQKILSKLVAKNNQGTLDKTSH